MLFSRFANRETGAAPIDWIVGSVVCAGLAFVALSTLSVGVNNEANISGLAGELSGISTTSYDTMPQPVRLINSASSGGMVVCSDNLPSSIVSQCTTSPLITTELWSMSNGAQWERVVESNAGEAIISTVFVGGRMVSIGGGLNMRARWFDDRGNIIR